MVSEGRGTHSAAAPQARRRRGRSRRSALALALVGCAVLAAASLVLPLAPVFDPWGWLIWARELGAGELDTSAGPSWKPLPVFLALPLAGSEQLAPGWWLWLARSGWLAAPVLAAALAARLAGGGRDAWAAGALAAAGTLLLHDPLTAWARQFAGGLSEPLLCALVLGAILAALAERPWLTGTLALGACLLRPEAWPFGALWALWAVRSGRLPAAAALAGAALVPLAWFVPDLLGAGDPLTGAARARGAGGAPAAESLEVLGRALALAPVALWLGAAWLLAGAWRHRGDAGTSQDKVALVLGAGALAWIAVVAVLAAAGYAGLPRFMAPAAVVVCVLGAVGLVRVFEAARAAWAGGGAGPVAGSSGEGGSGTARRRGRSLAQGAGTRTAIITAALLVLAACALDLGLRVERVPGEVDAARAFATGVDELFTLADKGEELRACPPLASSDLYTLTALAWRLELPLSAVTYSGRLYPRQGTAILGPNPPPGVRTQARLRAEPFATEGRWEAYRAGSCGGE